MKEHETILITGATGFIGHHLLQDLDPATYNIRLITRKNSNKLAELYPQFDVHQADLNNLDQVMQVCKGVDIIINTAAEVRNSANLEKTNVGGTKNLVSAIKAHHINKVIHLSSVGVAGYQYSRNRIVITENSVCAPKNEYEKTKLISEELFLEAQKETQFKLDIIRPTNVFGEHHPFDALLGLINHTLHENPFIYTKHAHVNYVYVKDITALILKLLKSSKQHGVINIGKSIELISFYHLIKQVLQTNNREIVIPGFIIATLNNLGFKKFQAISNQVVYSDNKLKEFFDYPYGEFEGLKRTIQHYKRLNKLR